MLSLTPLGQAVIKEDKYLLENVTKLLVHYFIMDPNDGALIWSFLYKLAAAKRRLNDEKELRRTVKELAEKYGYKCSFLYQLVTITTSLISWRFDYHKKMKHLMHESTYKYNLNTGNPPFWHHQFDKKMSIEEVFQCIENHDKSTLKNFLF